MRGKAKVGFALALVFLLCIPLRGDVQTVGFGVFSGGTVGGSTTFSSAVTFSSTTTHTGVAGFADGALATPSIMFTSDSDGTGTGWYRSAADTIATVTNGGTRMTASNTGVNFIGGSGFIPVAGPNMFKAWNGGGFCWSSTANAESGTCDTLLSREAAATVQLGLDVNGAAVNQVVKGHDGITGSNILGASLSLKPGLGTGSAVSGVVDVYRDLTKSSGTTAQTYGQAWVACPSKILSNTSATAQTVATITTTTTTGGTVVMDYSVVANNGTLQDIDAGTTKTSWGNNAGTVAATMSAVYGQSDQDASGTLAATPTATVATNVVSIKLTPTWVTIVPTTVTAFINFQVFGQDSVVCN